MPVNNNAIKGSLVILKLGNEDGPPETFTALTGSRNATVNFGNEAIDVTTADDIDETGVTWSSTIPGRVNYSVSLTGVILNAAAFKAILDLSLTGAQRNFQLEVKDKFTIEGPGTLTAAGIEGNFDAEAGYSMTMNGAGAQTITLAT